MLKESWNTLKYSAGNILKNLKLIDFLFNIRGALNIQNLSIPRFSQAQFALHCSNDIDQLGKPSKYSSKNPKTCSDNDFSIYFSSWTSLLLEQESSALSCQFN